MMWKRINKRQTSKIALAFIILLALLGTIFVVLYNFSTLIERTALFVLNKQLGAEGFVSFERIEGNLLGNIRIINGRFSSKNLQFQTTSIEASYKLSGFLSGTPQFKRIFINHPQILILDSASTAIDTTQKYSVKKSSTDTLELPITPEMLPEIKIEELVINSGILVYKGTVIDSLNYRANLNISQKKFGLHQQQLTARWKEKDIHLKKFKFVIQGDSKRCQVNQIEAEINQSRFFAHAEIEFVPKFRILAFMDTSNIHLTLLNRFLKENPYREGNLQFYANFMGTPRNFQTDIYLSGWADSLRIDRLNAHIEKDGNLIRLQKFNLVSNAGKFAGEAVFSPGQQRNTRISFQDIRLEKTGLVNAATQINGKLQLNFTGKTINDMNGTGKLLLTHCRIDSIQFDSLSVMLAAKKGSWFLKNGSRLVLGDDSKFYVNGTLGKDRTLFVNLTSDDNNLATLDRKLNINLLKGHGSLDVVVGGRLNNPDIFGYVLLDSLEAAGVQSYGVEGRFELIGLTNERIGYFQLDLLSGKIGSTVITDGIVAAKINQDTVFIDSIGFDNYENYFITSGKVVRQENGMDIRLDRFNLHYEDYLLHPPTPIEAVFSGNKLFIENFYLVAENAGEIEIRGETDFTNQQELALYLRNISLAPLNQMLNLSERVGGKLEFEALISGSFENPEIELNVDLKSASVGRQILGDFYATIHFSDSVIQIEKFTADLIGDGQVTLNGEFVLPAKKSFQGRWQLSEEHYNRLNLHIKNFRIDDYLLLMNVNYPLKGRLSADVSLAGTYFNPVGQFRIACDSLIMKEIEIYSGYLQGRVNPRQILLDEGLVNLNGSEISFAGVKGISWDPQHPDSLFSERSIRLAFTVEEDSLQFLPILSPELELLTGEISVSGKVSGTLDKPKLFDLQGYVKNGTLYLAKLENPITDINFDLALEDKKIILDQFHARSAKEEETRNIWKKIWRFISKPVRRVLGGPSRDENIRISGEIDISDLYRPKLNLDARLDNAYFNYFLENTKVWLSAENLKITGRDTILINGDIQLHRGEIGLDLVESEKNLLLSTTVREKPPFIAYNLHIDIPGNVFVRSESNFNSFNMQLSGDLWVTQKPHELLEMTGSLEIFSGGQYFQFEEFTIQKGEVRFPNPTAYPEIELEAQKRKYGYVFVLHVSGPLNNPAKEIRILDGTTYEDKTYLYPGTKDQISMLLFGVTFDELGEGALVEKGQEVLQQTVMNRVEREARRFIGVDQIKIVQNNTSSSLNKDLNGTSLSLGKYLTPKLFLEYRTRMESAGLPGLGGIGAPRLNWESGNQIFLEYRINRNWSISTYYEKQENEVFKIDLSWRHEF